MKLALRFSLAFVAGMCLVWSVSSYLRVKREIALFENDMRRDHALMGRDLGLAVARIWKLSGPESARQFVQEANESEERVIISWLEPGRRPGDTEDAVLSPAEESALATGSAVTSRRVARGTQPRLYSWIPVTVGDGTVGILQISESLESKNRYIRATLIRTGVTTAVVVLVSGAIAVILGIAFVGRPVESLIAKARRVAAGDLTGEVTLRQSDELSLLADEMNAMSSRLDLAYRRIEEEKAAREAALEQLRHADRLMTAGKMASAVAHELGTPLNVILVRAKMIASEEVQGDEAGDCARIIAGQADHMANKIRELLDLARRRKPQRAITDLVRLVRRTEALLGPLAKGRGVAIESAGPDEPLCARVDADQIQQILVNLAVNGMEAMPDGGRLEFSWGRAEREGQFVTGRRRLRPFARLDVRDTGIGIDPGDVDKLFVPFHTSKGHSGGTGLGLSISADIAREHGGWIEVAAGSERGSCFSVFIPSEEEPCADAS